MAENMRVRVVLDLVDRVLAPLKRISGGGSEAAKQLKATRDRLKELGHQNAAIANLQKMQQTLAEAGNQLKIRTAMLESMRRAGQASQAQIAREESAVRKMTQALADQRAKAGQMRVALNAMGVGQLGSAQQRIKSDIDAATAAMARQEAQLKRIAQLKGAQDKAMLRTGMAVGAGYAMRHAGTSMTHGLAGPMHEGKRTANEELRIAALGLGDGQTKEAIAFAKGMKTYGTSQAENLGLMRDAITVFSDVRKAKMVTPLLAKMKFGNEAIFGAQHAEDNEKKFMDMLKVIELRGGLESQASFARQANIVQQVLTATGGRVGPEEWLNLIKTGGVAAKGIKDEAFYYQLEPLVQEMGGNRVGTAMMSAYQNIYQGKTTKRAAMMLDSLGLIADTSKVKHDKVGQISQLDVGALKGSELFRENQFEWMEKVLLPQLAAKGITEKQQVLDAMGGIFSNRTASSLFAQMYLQREQVHKNAALNARADGIDALYDKGKQSPAGAELELLKRRDDAYGEFSRAIMPAYVQALEVATGALKGLLGIMREYPTLTKVIGVGLGGIALLMMGMGALLIPLALIVGKAMLLRFVLARLGVSLFGAGTAAAAAGQGMGLLYRVGHGLGRAFAILRTGAAWLLGGLRVLAAFMVANPIVAAFALLAAAAFMVWRNWDGIKGGLLAIWEQLSAAVGAWWSSTTAGAAALWQTLVGLKDRFFTAGGDLMQGLVNGITSRLAAVRAAVVGAADAVGTWFREKLGINSPSRVFIDYGGWISEGAALGIQGGQGAVRTAALAVAAAAALPMQAAAAVPPALRTPAAAMPQVVSGAALRMDTRAPLAAPAPAQAGAGGGGATTIHITIHAAAGMDPQELARAVSAELDRRERAKRSRVNSLMSDID